MGSVGGAFLQAVGTKTQEVAKDVGDLKNLSFVSNNDDIIVMPTNTLIANPIVLAKWRFNKEGATPTTYSFARASTVISAHGRRTAGTGSAILGIADSVDGSVWDTLISVGFTGASFVDSGGIQTMSAFGNDMEFVAVILYSNNVNTEAEIKNVTGQLQSILPKGWTLERQI